MLLRTYVLYKFIKNEETEKAEDVSHALFKEGAEFERYASEADSSHHEDDHGAQDLLSSAEFSSSKNHQLNDFVSRKTKFYI